MNKFLYIKPFIITILSLLVIGGMFYWFAYRPSRIRHDCSWVKRVTTATPVQPAITKEDVEASKSEYDKCKKDVSAGIPNLGSGYVSIRPGDNPFACIGILKKEQPAIPAKQGGEIYYIKATKEQYDSCIRENGLWR